MIAPSVCGLCVGKHLPGTNMAAQQQHFCQGKLDFSEERGSIRKIDHFVNYNQQNSSLSEMYKKRGPPPRANA
jgi:hypothetical protein